MIRQRVPTFQYPYRLDPVVIEQLSTWSHLMDIQKLENNADIRIKFASINERGGYDGDSHDEYRALFPQTTGKLTEGWQYEYVGLVETRFEYDRSAWRLKHQSSGITVATIEHETGIEILVGIASGVATAAIIGLSKWLWNQWQDVRGPNKRSSSLVAEKVTERDTDGNIRYIERIEIRGPIDTTTVNAAIEQIFES